MTQHTITVELLVYQNGDKWGVGTDRDNHTHLARTLSVWEKNVESFTRRGDNPEFLAIARAMVAFIESLPPVEPTRFGYVGTWVTNNSKTLYSAVRLINGTYSLTRHEDGWDITRTWAEMNASGTFTAVERG